MVALAVFGSVLVVCAAGLLAWRMWLAQAREMRQFETRETDAALRSMPALFKSLEDRIGVLEWKATGKR